MEPPWDVGMKICSNVPGHMTKMASSPIYDKNLQKSSEPRRMYVFVSEDHMLNWHSCKICYPLEIKVLLLLAHLSQSLIGELTR